MVRNFILNQTPLKPKTPVFATLSDSKKAVEFVYDVKPDFSHNAKLSSLNVLGTDNPDVKYLSTETRLSIPRLLFVTPGANKDMSEIINQIKDWVNRGQLLTFTNGETLLQRCYINTFNYRIKQTRAGKPTDVEANITFRIERLSSVTQETISKKITTREQIKIRDIIEEARKKAINRVRLGIQNDSDTVRVDDQGRVEIVNQNGNVIKSLSLNEVRLLGFFEGIR